MRIFLIFLVFASGLGHPLQVAANNWLREATHSPALSGLLSFSVGAALLALIAISGLMNRGSLQGVWNAPGWVWLGGACGALSLVSGMLALPRDQRYWRDRDRRFRQLLASIVIDHLGWLNVQSVRINLPRVAGRATVIHGRDFD